MAYSTNLRMQAVLFAHELGHNLGLPHLGTQDGKWVMEPSVNSAPWDFTDTNAADIRNSVVFGGCGRHD
jgi:hypothetical protein